MDWFTLNSLTSSLVELHGRVYIGHFTVFFSDVRTMHACREKGEGPRQIEITFVLRGEGTGRKKQGRTIYLEDG